MHKNRQNKIDRLLKIYDWNYEYVPPEKKPEELRTKYSQELDMMTEKEIDYEYEDTKQNCVLTEEDVDQIVRNSKGE
tara:strand:+ start:2400 stop:2630 length:231 start_codon:yes stop_codon:yes gene_type:complete